MAIIGVTFLCWASAFAIWLLNKYAFKHPTTRIIPKFLRHTWFAGLSIIIATFIFCLPGFLAGFWAITALVLAALLVKFRDQGLKLFIEDLKQHKSDGRGIFQHSEDCYMTGGETATFMKKSLEKHGINPFDQK
ncbi:MAG: hypothetical protein RMJ15_00455 [Nitrososphaerota archaeon]|nr:hypothetical protein [Candidatus Bathyarchaeota archaeon]MDW8022205.1 hypothetical protein [Nitrososphaerota archaeon]